MPRNVRNFWLELKVDGRDSRIETGPVSKDGGFELRILMRDKGGIKEAASVWGHADDNGKLVLHMKPEGVPGTNQISVHTER